MGNLKRRSTRVNAGFEATIVMEIPVVTRNLSMKGMLCAADGRTENGLECNVSIKLSDDKTVEVEGHVIRMDKEGLVVGFDAMNQECFADLKRLVSLNAPDADRIDRELSGRERELG